MFVFYDKQIIEHVKSTKNINCQANRLDQKQPPLIPTKDKKKYDKPISILKFSNASNIVLFPQRYSISSTKTTPDGTNPASRNEADFFEKTLLGKSALRTKFSGISSTESGWPSTY